MAEDNKPELKQALRNMISDTQQISAPFRDKARGVIGGWQDSLTSDPENDILGPAAATGLGMAQDMFVPDPALDRPEDFFAPSMGSLAKVGRGVAKGIDPKDGEQALKLLKSIKPDLPDSIGPGEAKMIMERVMNKNKAGADEILGVGKKIDQQDLISRDVRRSDQGFGHVQPEPTVPIKGSPRGKGG